MADRAFNVLFLCTGNSARSILAESILKKDGAPHFNAYSAGSQPRGAVNPFALDVLENYGYPIEGLRSKSWEEFSSPDAPQMDFIFTVCDNAAGEACPVWPGHPASAHWGIDDPADAGTNDLATKTAFITAFKYLRNRISAFIALPLTSLDRASLLNRLTGIGNIEGASKLIDKCPR